MFPKKYIFIIIFIFAILLCGKEARAATEFVSTIRATGGNYSLLSTWEAAVQSNLTASTTVVYSGTGTGGLPAGTVLELFRGGVYQDITASTTATTTAQILVNSFSGAYKVLQDGDQWRVASSTDNMWTVSSAGLGDSAIAVAECYNDWPTGLADNLTISGWTTSASNYVKVYAPAGQRHNGWTWTNTSKNVYSGFALKDTRGGWPSSATLNIQTNYVRISGLIINGNHVNSGWGVVSYNNSPSSGSYLENSIIFNSNGSAGGGGQGIQVGAGDPSGGGVRVSNTLIYDCETGGFLLSGWSNNVNYLNNVTIVDCGYGIHYASGYSSKLVAKNVLSYSNSTADFTTGNYSCDNCASSDATADDNGGTGNRINQTFSFVDEANDNFHLSSSDRGARNQGTNLSADASYPITDDIDYQTRPAAGSNQQWDIGADETFSATQINSPQTNVLNDDSLVGYWSFNGPDMDWSQTTAEARDLSGNANHGDVINGAKPVAGISGQALSFDGVNDYVRATNSLASLDAHSVSLWFKPNFNSNATGVKELIVRKGVSGDSPRAARITHENGVIITDSKGLYAYSCQPFFNSGEWHHISYSRIGTNNIKFYFDGAYITTTKAVDNGGINANEGLPFNIGSAVEEYFYGGLIDEVRVYNRALSADEIGQLYRSGARKMKIDPTKGFKAIIR